MPLPRLLLAFAAAAALAACATPPKTVRNACEIFEETGGWYKATRKAEKRWGLPKATQLAIIRAESGFDDDAKPARGRFLFIFPGKRPSSAYGYSQATDGTWDLYKRSTGNSGADRDDFDDAADFVSWYGRQSNRRAGVPMSDPYRQYLAYHEGWGGYSRGSYRGNGALQAKARRVAAASATYQSQLNRCEKRLRRGIPLIPFI